MSSRAGAGGTVASPRRRKQAKPQHLRSEEETEEEEMEEMEEVDGGPTRTRVPSENSMRLKRVRVNPESHFIW